MQVEFVDLRIFVAVADTGSITAGAERVALSLAAASARIRALELQVGAALFERGRRGVSLTAAGQVLLRHARVGRSPCGWLPTRPRCRNGCPSAWPTFCWRIPAWT